MNRVKSLLLREREASAWGSSSTGWLASGAELSGSEASGVELSPEPSGVDWSGSVTLVSG